MRVDVHSTLWGPTLQAAVFPPPPKLGLQGLTLGRFSLHTHPPSLESSSARPHMRVRTCAVPQGPR